MFGRLVAIVLAAAVIGPVGVTAAPIVLQVDPNQSYANVQLCVSIGSLVCDNDVSPVDGTTILSLDCPIAPAGVTLHDFTFLLTEPIDLDLVFGFFGRLVSTAGNVSLSYANPGTPLPPAALVGDTFTIPGVPVDAQGQLDYEATGLVCASFAGLGMLCTDSIDLSTLATDPVDMVGTLTVAGGAATMTLDLDVSGPLVPEDPTLAVFSMTAAVVARGTLPVTWPAGDLTGDDVVDLSDLPSFSDCLLGVGVSPTGICQCADLDADDDVDLEDYAIFQHAFDGLLPG